MPGSFRAAAPAPRRVDRFAPRHRHQPSLRPIGYAVLRPIEKHGREAVGQSVLRPRHISRAPRQISDELAIAPTRRRFGGCPGVLVIGAGHVPTYISQIGRTSITPWLPA